MATPSGDKGGRALDLHHVDLGPRRDRRRVLDVGTRGPFLAVDTNPSAVVGDLFEHDGRAADEGGGSCAQLRGLLDVPERDRADEDEPGPGRDGKRDELQGEAEVERPYHRGDHGRRRDDAKGERGGEEFGYAEHRRHDQPDDPGLHGRSA